jgi:hypothetical protein
MGAFSFSSILLSMSMGCPPSYLFSLAKEEGIPGVMID